MHRSRVPRFGKAHLLHALPHLCSCSSLHESFWVLLLPAGDPAAHPEGGVCACDGVEACGEELHFRFGL